MFAAKVGQEVGFYRSGSWGSIHSTGFGIVRKVNGYGHITVTNENTVKVFDKYGHERNTKYGGVQLIDAARLREILAAEQARRDRRNKAKELEQQLKDMWSYSGDFHVDDAKKTELKAMIDAL